jgi:S1-C subfamily serine protease
MRRLLPLLALAGCAAQPCAAPGALRLSAEGRQATAFLVRGSEGAEGLPRLVTAAHAVAGVRIATIHLPGGPQPAAPLVVAPERDLAVLIPLPASPEDAARWRAEPALPLAPRQRRDSALRARFEDAVPAPGASGSPVLDAEGRVRGVLRSAAAATRAAMAEPVADVAVLAALNAAGRTVATAAEGRRGHAFAVTAPIACVLASGMAVEGPRGAVLAAR